MEPNDLGPLLTTIQVSIAELRGDVRELAADLRGRADNQDRDISALRQRVDSHTRQLNELRRAGVATTAETRGRRIGLALGAALAGSGMTAGVIELLGRTA